MAQEITVYDEYIESVDWLAEADLPVAITLTEVLQPSEGNDAIIFPPTFAVGKTARHPYQIDVLDEKLTPQEAEKAGLEANNCLIDSVGSQANRMESVFKQPPLNKLVPQITVNPSQLSVGRLCRKQFTPSNTGSRKTATLLKRLVITLK